MGRTGARQMGRATCREPHIRSRSAAIRGRRSRAGSGVRIMTVLMTADTVGGVWTYALDLSRALGQRGVLVVLATMGPPPSRAQRREAAAIPTVQLVHGDYKLAWMDE